MSGEESQPSDDQAARTIQLDWSWSAQKSHPATSNLPQELFAQIIREVYWLIRREASYNQWGSNWSSPYQLVCRAWRDVIRSTPSFWSQEIRASRNPEWLEVCLERCAGSPATVFVFTPHEPSTTFAILRHYASCISACYIQTGSEGTWAEGLSSLLTTSLPLLETLSIGALYENIANASITHDLLPRLTTLSLDYCSPPRDTTIYASLRNLTLSQSPWQISFTDFLDVMGHCGNLESLSLDSILFNQFHETITSAAMRHSLRGTPVDLPSLRVLKLSGSREVLLNFLAILRAPLVTTLEAVTFVDLAHPGPHISQLMAPNIQLRHPLLCFPTAVSIRCQDGDFELSLGGAKPDERLFLGIYSNHTGDPFAWNVDLEPNIMATIDTFSFDRVETLQVDGCLEDVCADVWQRVFQTCWELRVLHLKGRGAIHSIWQGFWSATISSPSPDAVLCCPLLAEIIVYSNQYGTPFTATPTLFEMLRGTLCARADQSGTRLKKLKMTLRYYHELWNDTAEHDAVVEEIRGLVEEFEYDSVLTV
ncbi:hypothetical protein V8D89_000537 [Ganoderma adspersum]